MREVRTGVGMLPEMCQLGITKQHSEGTQHHDARQLVWLHECTMKVQ